jgi:hypothetical protein
MDYILKNHKTTKVEGFYGEMYLLDETNGRVAIIGKFGIGSPVVATLLEELIAFELESLFLLAQQELYKKTSKLVV